MGLLIDIAFVKYGIVITLFRFFCIGLKYNIENEDDVITFTIGIWKCHANLKLMLKGTAYV
jgi:hypothetical protein